MAENQRSQIVLYPSPPLEGIVRMPWDLGRYFSQKANLLKGTICIGSKNMPDSHLPSRLFTIPLDILEQLLGWLTKKDAFQLYQTCKHFMRHPLVLKAIFHEPISVSEIDLWYQTNPVWSNGPSVTWGINASTGPLVRRLALPNWTSEEEVHHLTAHCPNLDAVDFTEILEAPHDSTSYGEDIDYWPSMLDRCPALFRNLRSVHLPYGISKPVWCHRNDEELDHWCRRNDVQVNHRARLPKILSLAENLQNLSITCQQEPTMRTSPETRREASANLVADIVDNVSRGLTTVALYKSESTIDNLKSFVQSLAVFPKLRTIKISLHRDLHVYQKVSHTLNDFKFIRNSILSNPYGAYEHDTASVLQYLSLIKEISDEGRFTIVSSDSGEDFHYLPREFYGIGQTELVPGPRDDLWAPVWTWNDRLSWIGFHQNDPRSENVDIGQCRSLFEELIRARIPVSVELEPLSTSLGAFFADAWDGIPAQRNCDYEWKANYGNYLRPLPGKKPVARTNQQEPKQHFKDRHALTKSSSLVYGTFGGAGDPSPQMISANCAVYKERFSYSLYNQRHGIHSPALAPHVLPIKSTQQKEQPGKIAGSNGKPNASYTIDAGPDIPHPIWRLNEIGDLVDDLRLIGDRQFAYEYTVHYAANYDYPDPNWIKWSKIVQNCKSHLRERLWREAEYLALLFRCIPVDFPRLTRFALYIPAALYPDHDQTFINHALPGTGWTVSHYGKHHQAVGGGLRHTPVDNTRLELADDICPFIRRIFTRPTPTDDPAKVIIHDEEWHVTKRPRVDLDGELKSMEQLLTEPLRENYTV